MLPYGFKRKENCAMLFQRACVGDPLQMTINSNDKVMEKLSLVDFDGEGMKVLNKPRGKTPRQ